MQAIQIAIAATAGTGDEVIVPTPAWPNFAAAVGIGGARPVSVPLDFDGTRWTLDLDRLFAAVSDKTRAIFLNSPANPTGWTATAAELRAILGFARERGLWIVADEVYSRFVYDGRRARAVLLRPDRRGRPRHLRQHLLQELGDDRLADRLAGRAAGARRRHREPDPVFDLRRRRLHAARRDRGAGGGRGFRPHAGRARRRPGASIVCEGLAGSNRVRFAWPDGAFYLFFTIEGAADTGRLGLTLVDEANIGIAPGTAFGPGGEDFMRLCFARKAEDLAEATRRLRAWLGS